MSYGTKKSPQTAKNINKKNRQKIVTYNVTTTDDIARFVI